jgi:DNA replication protein DnaC
MISVASLIKNKGFHLKPVEINCDTHGIQKANDRFFNGKLRTKAHCQLCFNSKLAQEDKDTASLRKVSTLPRHNPLNLYPQLQGHSLESYNQQKYPMAKVAYDFSAGYCVNLKARMMNCVNVVFRGDIGAGKTFFSISILKEAITQGYTAKYVIVSELFSEIKKSYNYADMSAEEIVERLVSPDFLVLDEIGLSFNSNLEKVTYFELINKRCLQNKPTIVASNLDVSGLKNVMGNRAVDRLMDAKSAQLYFNWGSLRGVA